MFLRQFCHFVLHLVRTTRNKTMTKRLEINFKRLLEKSEAMAAADDSGDVWRLEQVSATAQEYFLLL